MQRMNEHASQNPGLVGHLDRLVREHPEFEVLSESPSNFYCFRYVPNGLAEHQEQGEVRRLLDCVNEEIVNSAHREGFGLVSMTHVLGRAAICISINADISLREEVDATFEAIARWGRTLSRKHRSSVISLTRGMESTQCFSESHSSSTEVSVT